MVVVSKGVKGGYVVTRAVANTSYWLNNDSDGGANSAGETVDRMYLSAIWWSNKAATDIITIDRGTDTILQLGGIDDWDFQEKGVQLETAAQAAANVVVTTSTTANSVVVMKFHKESTET